MNELVLAELEKLTNATGQVITSHKEAIEDLLTRVEGIEALHDRPKLSGNRQATEYKKFETSNGPVFELPSHVKMADVSELQAEKKPEISLGRWLGATVAGDRCGDAEALKYVRESKQMVTTSTGVLIPAQYISQWIDLIRAQSVLNTAGMRTVTMAGKTQVHSAVTVDPLATWHSEAGSISADNPTFAARTLSAETIVVRCQGSVELVQDSPDFGEQLARVMTKAMGQEIDRVGLHGSGTPPEPQGIFGTSNILTETGVGTPTNFAELLSGVRKLLEENMPLEVATANAIMSPRTWATYEGLVTGISSDLTQLPRPRALENMRFLVTTGVSNALGSDSPLDDSAIFLGDFRDLLMGVRREASIEVLKATTYASNLLLEFIGYARVDFLVTRPTSFCVLTGVDD
ncbi:MAG: phage major capsid protein [Woeseia sp.]